MRGWLRVQSYTDPPDALLQHRTWWLSCPRDAAAPAPKAHRVLESSAAGPALRVRLEGIADREAAESLRNCEVLVERAELPATGPREYFREDLLGFTVRNTQGVVLGSLQHFLAVPATPVMWIKGEREYAVPAAPPHLRRVDLARGEIEVDWPADF